MTAKFTPETQAAIDQAEQLVEAFFAAHPELDPKTTKLEISGGKITGYETQTPVGYYAISTNSPPLDLSKAPLSGDYSPYTKLFMPGVYDPQADWRSEAWETRRKLLADMAKSLNIPLELLDLPAANHYNFLQPGEPMTTQNAWFQLTLKLNQSEATYRQLAEDCLTCWDYPGAARWRAMADGLELARNHMEELAAQVRDQIAKQPVGSATQPPAAGGIPIP